MSARRSRQYGENGSRLRVMKPLTLTFKITRIVIAIGVSLWMTSGCLLTCSKGEVRPVELTRSINGSHSCCHRPLSKKSRASRPTTKDTALIANLTGSAKECPLAANANAIAAKKSGASGGAAAATAVVPNLASRSERSPVVFSSSSFCNPSPTYLRCCVFLI